MMLCTNTMLSRVRVGSPLTVRAAEEARMDAGNGFGAAMGSVCSTGSSVLGVGQVGLDQGRWSRTEERLDARLIQPAGAESQHDGRFSAVRVQVAVGG